MAEGSHRLTTLDSGLRVVTEAMLSVRSVAVGFWIDGGSLVESAEQAGLAHLVEHMIFRGTERFASVEIDQYRLRSPFVPANTEPFSSCVCLADLQYVDGLCELAGAPGAAAQLTQDVPGLELGVRALAG